MNGADLAEKIIDQYYGDTDTLEDGAKQLLKDIADLCHRYEMELNDWLTAKGINVNL